MTKKRITKRIMAVVVATLVLMTMVLPASAAPSQPNTGKITVHKYGGAGYGYNTDNEYTGEAIPDGDPSHPAENGYAKLQGVGFSLYSLNMTAVNTRIAGGDIVTGYTAVNNVVTFIFDNAPTVNVTGTAEGAQQLTDANGEIVFGGSLTDGYYVLVETAPLAGYDAAAPAVIRTPLTNSDGTLNYDVHVYPKNVSITNLVVKKLGDGGAKPIAKGDNVPFELLAKFRNTDTAPHQVLTVNDLRGGTSPTYTYGKAEIIDTLHADLVYKNDVAVYWMANDGNLSTTTLASDEYTMTASGTAGAGGRIVTVTLTNKGIDTAIANQYPGFGITLSADYTGVASAGGTATNITNKMGAIITKAESPNKPPTEVTIYAPQLQITIDKVAKVTGGTAMVDVEFMLLTTGTPTVNYESGTPWSDYTSAQKTAIEAQYVIGADGFPVTGTTNGSGKVTFSNLPGYVDASGVSFWIKETKTNAGYQLKTALIQVDFASKATYEADSTTEHWFDDEGNWTENVTVSNSVEIINYEKGDDPEEPIFSLPLTGGAGTLAFTIAGIVVMLGAAVLIIRKKKKA